MTTQQILSAAYAKAFDIDVSESGCYYGQQLNDAKTGAEITIDYAHFDFHSRPFDFDSDNFIAHTSSGNEGCFIDVVLVHFNKDKVQYDKSHCGTIKTLSEGLPAWRAMGALAGELTYLSDSVSWDLHRANLQAHK